MTRALFRRVLRAVVILPGTALGYVPALILWLTWDGAAGGVWSGPGDVWFWLALVAAVAALPLMAGAMRLFVTRGEGTPAPWDPPRRLVVRGPYRYVRNPMISGVAAFLGAETLYFQSWPLGLWMLVFVAGNAVYFPLSEEPGLERRFGDDYRVYKANVPRWLPRLTPWTAPDKQ